MAYVSQQVRAVVYGHVDLSAVEVDDFSFASGYCARVLN